MTQQRYVADELTHFVGSKLKSDEERFNLLVTILKTGILAPGGSLVNSKLASYVFGGSPLDLQDGEIFLTSRVCFCDIPLADLSIHIKKFGPFGIAFAKRFLVEKGASPVFYIAEDSLINGTLLRGGAFIDTIALLLREVGPAVGPEVSPERARLNKDQRELWSGLTWHLLLYLKFFDSHLDDDDHKNYYMEREWRVINGFRFQLEDVKRIVIPREYAVKFRESLPEYVAQIHFPPEA